MENRELKFSLDLLLVPLFAVLSIWLVFFFEVRLGTTFNSFGLLPRTLLGLRGVVFSPFIHGSLEHLYNNTIPLAVLTLCLFYFYRQEAWRVLLLGWLLSGLLTWVIGRESYHIGASGIIYVLVSFIFFKGVFQRHYRLVALSLTIVFLYGGLLWYIFPVKDGVSWEGHLSGFLTGLLLARTVKIAPLSKPKYDWEKEGYDETQDEFMQHFDAQGNFIEPTSEEEDSTKIVYHYKREERD